MPSVWLLSGNPQVLDFPEAATQTGLWADGDLVDLSSSGLVQAGTAGNFIGICRKTATGTTSTKIPVELLDPNALYVATYSGTITQALVGDLLDFTFTVGGHTLLETFATTDVYCVGLYDAVNTVSGRLIVRFLGALFTSAF